MSVRPSARMENCSHWKDFMKFDIWGKRKGKGKSVPFETGSGPEGSRKLRFTDFKTAIQDDGKVSLRHRPLLTPRKYSGTHFC